MPGGRREPLGIGLKVRADFLRVGKGRRLHGRAMSLQVAGRDTASDGNEAPRFGLTVTRKIGGAVERNRIKRRLRAVLRTPDLSPAPAHDYVMVARRDALTMPFEALVADLTRLLRLARDPGAKRRPARPHPGTRPDRDRGSVPS